MPLKTTFLFFLALTLYSLEHTVASFAVQWTSFMPRFTSLLESNDLLQNKKSHYHDDSFLVAGNGYS
jgi:hypothetical protein